MTFEFIRPDFLWLLVAVLPLALALYFQTQKHSRKQPLIAAHLAQFIRGFNQAEFGGKPLFGAQQIPGDDADLRAAAVSFEQHNYARAEIVKASSALTAADQILDKLVELNLAKMKQPSSREMQFPITMQLDRNAITQLAMELAVHRNYPAALALPYHARSSRNKAKLSKTTEIIEKIVKPTAENVS